MAGGVVGGVVAVTITAGEDGGAAGHDDGGSVCGEPVETKEEVEIEVVPSAVGCWCCGRSAVGP